MTILAFALCIIAQLFLLIGQLFFKRAMDPGEGKSHATGPTFQLLALGIVTQTIYFFLWLGLIGNHPLTRIFPFEGLNPVMMAILAWLVLNEKLSITSWLGLALVCVGIGIVTVS